MDRTQKYASHSSKTGPEAAYLKPIETLTALKMKQRAQIEMQTVLAAASQSEQMEKQLSRGPYNVFSQFEKLFS